MTDTRMVDSVMAVIDRGIDVLKAEHTQLLLGPLAERCIDRYVEMVFQNNAVAAVVAALENGIGDDEILSEVLDLAQETIIGHNIAPDDPILPFWDALNEVICSRFNASDMLFSIQAKQREGIERQWVDTNVEPNRILTFDEVERLGLDGTLRSES